MLDAQERAGPPVRSADPRAPRPPRAPQRHAAARPRRRRRAANRLLVGVRAARAAPDAAPGHEAAMEAVPELPPRHRDAPPRAARRRSPGARVIVSAA